MTVLARVLPDKLWQSGQPGSLYGPTWDEVFDAGIDTIVDLYCHGRSEVRAGFINVYWPFRDSADDKEPLLPDRETLDALVIFIDSLLAAGRKVLVHCQAGMNRSALVAALVVCKGLDCDGADALRRLQRVSHENVLFNPAYRRHVLSQRASTSVP